MSMENERIKTLKAFLDEDPNDVFTLYALGLECIKTEDSEAAGKYFEKALAINDNYLPVYYQLGKILESREPQKAGAIYEKGMLVARALGKNHTYKELKNAFDLFNGNIDPFEDD